jgi:hypothetical protein
VGRVDLFSVSDSRAVIPAVTGGAFVYGSPASDGGDQPRFFTAEGAMVAAHLFYCPLAHYADAIEEIMGRALKVRS